MPDGIANGVVTSVAMLKHSVDTERKRPFVARSEASLPPVIVASYGL
jgi:hypothetical protein